MRKKRLLADHEALLRELPASQKGIALATIRDVMVAPGSLTTIWSMLPSARQLWEEELGPAAIARRLRIAPASVYRVLSRKAPHVDGAWMEPAQVGTVRARTRRHAEERPTRGWHMSRISLERIDPTRNRRRFYTLVVTPTLFGAGAGVGADRLSGAVRQGWLIKRPPPERLASRLGGRRAAEVLSGHHMTLSLIGMSQVRPDPSGAAS